MSLKYKTGFVLTLFFLVFGGIEYAILHLIIVPKFNALEEASVIKNATRVLQAIDRELHHLNLLCFDWAAWDDTYGFVDDRSEKYIKANLLLSTFTGNDINLIYIYNQNKKIVWGKAVDLATQKPLMLEAFDAARQPASSHFLNMVFENRQIPDIFINGILMTEYGPMLLASRPIVTSEYQGPVKGFLVMGRFLDKSLIQVLRDQTEVNFTIEPVSGDGEKPLVSGRRARLEGSATFFLEDLESNRILAGTTMSDLSGRPALSMKATFLKEISLGGLNTATVALYSFIGAAFLTLALGLFLKQRFVVCTFYRINMHAQNIARSKTSFVSMTLDRNDEIGELSHSVEQMKNNLLSIKDRIQAIIDSMPVILVCIDVRGQVRLVNKTAAEQGVNVNPGQAEPKLWDLIPQFLPFKEKVIDIVRSGEISSVYRRKVMREEQELYFDVIFYPLASSQEHQAVVLVRDVTRMVRMEQAAVRSEKMTSLGGLAAGMAHEINNPLAGILQNAQLIRNRLAESLPGNENAARDAGLTLESLKDYLEKRRIPSALDHIMESGTTAAKIVQGMLSFAKSQPLDKRPHSVTDILTEVLNTLWAGAGPDGSSALEKSIVVNEASHTDASVVCERDAIVQALVNILKNAVEILTAHPPESSPSRITIRFRKDSDLGEFEISDNGPGLSEDARKRLFEPFFSTKGPDQGSGLGLSLSYYIVVKDHGGELDVRSGQDGGATFIVRLPLA